MKKNNIFCLIFAAILLTFPLLSACNNDLSEPFEPYEGYERKAFTLCDGDHSPVGQPECYFNTDKEKAFFIFNCANCDGCQVVETTYALDDGTFSDDEKFSPALSSMKKLSASVTVGEKTYEKTAFVVTTHTVKQSQFLADSNDKVFLYANGSKEASRPEPVKLTWSEVKGFSKYDVLLSDENDIDEDDAIATVKGTEYSLTNLELGKTYYCQIVGKSLFKKEASKVFSFTTASSTPRNLHIEGVTNARDLGGYVTVSGRIVKQGLIYRMARLDALKTDKKANKAGIEVIDELDIESQIDLRGNDNDEVISAPLGKALDYYYFPMTTTKLVVTETEGNLAATKKIFETLADENNLPAVFHCSIGTDRTGYVAFMINALLGVSEEDLYYDYMFSCFGEIGGSRKNDPIDQYIEILNEFSDEATLQLKAYDYLENKVGVHPFYLDNLIENMLY